MQDFLGLYYPHITFPDDYWMKTAACFWDKMGRIVPTSYHLPDYYPPDSQVVRQLRDELDFVFDVPAFMSDRENVEAAFLKVIIQNCKELQQRYSLSNANEYFTEVVFGKN